MNDTRLLFNANELDLVTVAIGRNNSPPFHTHTGVVYKDGFKFHYLHLAWNCKLCNDPLPGNEYIFVRINIPAIRMRFYARLCAKIAERRQKLTYALKHPGNRARFVYETGGLVDSQNGLNCSTFVLVLFSSYGIQLVDPNEWPLRLEDADWHRTLVDWMKKGHPEQAALIEAEVGCQRIRPEETAGACLFDHIPASFNQSVFGSQWLMAFLPHRPIDCRII